MSSIVAAVMLVACGDPPSDAGATPAPTNKPSTPKSGGLPPEMVAAVSAGNNASAIGVHFALRATPVVNQPLPVEIAIVPHRDFGSLVAHFEAHSGLAVTVGDTLDSNGSAAAEKVISHQLVLLPREEGVFMITVGVNTDGQEGSVTRIFSIPVIVASQAPPAPPSAPSPTAPPASN